jgi:hypothetical protein
VKYTAADEPLGVAPELVTAKVRLAVAPSICAASDPGCPRGTSTG